MYVSFSRDTMYKDLITRSGCALDERKKSINSRMNAMRRAGRVVSAAKRNRLSAAKQRVILQQLEPVRGIEKIVIKPTGRMVKA